MPVKIRLARHGRSNRPFYHIVVADGRSPRDGKYIEKIGTYDPLNSPAKVVLDFDRALDWVMKGAQPTDTCRTLLSEQGVMFKKHLLVGVNKKAFSTEVADQRFQDWVSKKDVKDQSNLTDAQKKQSDARRDRMNAETKAKEAKAAAIAKKLADSAKSAEVAAPAEEGEAAAQ